MPSTLGQARIAAWLRVVSLPFKLIFFVLVEGWSLVAGSLVQSYGGGGSDLRPNGWIRRRAAL